MALKRSAHGSTERARKIQIEFTKLRWLIEQLRVETLRPAIEEAIRREH